MNWLTRLLPKVGVNSDNKRGIPEGVWGKCTACHAILYNEELRRLLEVCPKCGHHHPISARRRLLSFVDPDSHIEIAAEVQPIDRLKFKDSRRYKERLTTAQKATGEKDALIAFKGSLYGMPLVAVAFEFSFIGGSMGAVVGEKFVRAAIVCLENRIPLVCFAASGGARMQEGLVSLFQMAKTSAALAELSTRGIPFISVLTDPTMGGVSASLAMLGDIIIAEPKALIGFAGPRVIAQTVKETLPEGFQTSEFLLENGAIDMIVHRHEMRRRVASLLSKLTGQVMANELI